MASLQYYNQLGSFPLKRNQDVWYTPIHPNEPFDLPENEHMKVREPVVHMLTQPTPLVSTPLATYYQEQAAFIEPVGEGRPSVEAKEPSVTQRSGDHRKSSGSATVLAHSDVKWNGYVEYPESCERSSIAREAEHKISTELDEEGASNGKR